MDPQLRLIAEKAPHISPTLANDWLDRTRQVAASSLSASVKPPQTPAAFDEEVERLVTFHVRMLSGFGASDMSILYTAYTGGHHPFGTASDVVRKKLCVEAPEPPTGDLARGIAHEPHARALTLAKLSHLGLRPDHEARDKLRRWLDAGGSQEHPWLKAFPDGIFLTSAGLRIVAEYKSPYDHDSVEEMSLAPPDQHCVQLEQAKMCLELAGVKVDKLLLSPFSCKTWDVYPCYIDSSREREKTIIEAGDYYWDHVLRADIPGFNPTKSFQSVDALPERAQASMGRLLLFRRLNRQVESLANSARNSFYSELRQAGIDIDKLDQRTSVPCFNITFGQQKPKIDNRKLLEKFKEIGGDVDDPALYSDGATVMRLDTVRAKASPYTPMIERVDGLANRVIDLAQFEMADLLGIKSLSEITTTDPCAEPDASAIAPPEFELRQPGH